MWRPSFIMDKYLNKYAESIIFCRNHQSKRINHDYVIYVREMNFGIEILTIYSMSNTERYEYNIWDQTRCVIYWVAETYLVITLRIR